VTQQDSQASWRWIAIGGGAVALSLVVLLAVVLASGGDGDSGATPAPTATPSPSPTPFGQTPSPTPAPPESAYRLVYREFTPTEDVIWAAPPADPSQREELARIPHREGFGIKPSLSPDGKLLAYLSLPEYAVSGQSSQAIAYVMDLEAKESVQVAENVDLLFAPLWTPDGKYLYLRALAGPEFLAADVMILRVIVPPIGNNTPTPTPTPAPSQSQVPTPEPTAVVIRDSIAHVLNFIPVGFSYDGDSIYFVQIQGGTAQGSLLGLYSPATTESLAKAWELYLDALQAADQANAANPPPSETVTPQPTPAPQSRLVVEMSDQLAFEYSLRADGYWLSYVVQEFADDGTIVNRAYVADIVAAAVHGVSAESLPVGAHLRPVWHPTNGRLTFGILPGEGGPAFLVMVGVDGGDLEYLTTAPSGFDEPRKWSPDGNWLAVSHSEGTALTDRHDVRLDLVGINGFRTTVIAGADNATEDSVLGWITPDAGGE